MGNLFMSNKEQHEYAASLATTNPQITEIPLELVIKDALNNIASVDIPLPVGTKVETKLSNPKDTLAIERVPLSLVPGASIAYQALGHLEGHLKYGKTNWREAGVRFSVYLDAMLRHIEKLSDGEWEDPVTKVPHLGSILASAGILVDAYESGKLIDDRGKSAPTGETLDKLSPVVANLRKLYGDKNPKHYLHEGKINEYAPERS